MRSEARRLRSKNYGLTDPAESESRSTEKIGGGSGDFGKHEIIWVDFVLNLMWAGRLTERPSLRGANHFVSDAPPFRWFK